MIDAVRSKKKSIGRELFIRSSERERRSPRISRNGYCKKEEVSP
jgi:hypothetical protein